MPESKSVGAILRLAYAFVYLNALVAGSASLA